MNSILRTILILFVFILPIDGFTQTKAQIRKAEKLFKTKGEIHFWFLLKKKEDQKELTRVISIDHVHGDTIWAFANKRGLLRFFELGYSRFNLLKTPSELYREQTKKALKKGATSTTAAFDTYPTYAQYEQAMQQFETDYPSICKLVTLGTLPSGRKILALKISDSLSKRENEPQFFYTSSMHGDETAGYPLMLKLADELLSGYNQNPRLTFLVNNMELWINPLANPDGTYRGGNNSVNNATRFNANNIDLNRNYPDPQDGPHPDGEAYQPETKIFMAFADTMDFVMSANFHGGVEVANYPWDTWQKRPADEQWWITESVRFADSARSQAPANFFSPILGYPNLPGVTQGFEWYEVNGGRQDYMNWFHHCRELTVELSNTKLLPNNQIANHWTYYRESLLGFIEAALGGIRGVVKDQCTGKPVKARVFIQNLDKDSSHVYSTKAAGNYHRPIAPGTYSMEFSAPGYQTVVLPNVIVAQNQLAVVRSVNLQPQAPVATFSSQVPDLCGSSVTFSDGSGSANVWKWTFGDGDSSSVQNPTHSFSGPGIYQVTLSIQNCAGSDTISKVVRIVAPSTPVLSADTSFCGAKTHTLQANSDVVWYQNANGTSPLDTGATFISPPLTSTKTYYARNMVSLSIPNVGPASNTIGGGGYFTSNTYHYLIFDSKMAFNLKSVKVYANTTGNRTIQLRNSQGQVLLTRTVSIPQGESRVLLNFSIPVGQSLQLGINGGNSNNLYRNNANANYPYSYEGLVSITGNSAGNPAFYYYFYDWEISARCESGLVPVTTVVTNAPSPSVVLAGPTTSVCEGDSVSFQATANQALNPTFTWFSGATQIASGNPVKVLASLPGTNTITCQVLSSDTCAVNNPVTSAPLSIIVLPRPAAPVISLTSGGLLESGSGPVLWALDNQVLSIFPTTSFGPGQPGTYTAILQGVNGCSSLPSNPILYTAVGNLLEINNRVWFSSSSLWVDKKEGKSDGLEVLSVEGKVIMETTLNLGLNEISCQKLPSGFYTARMKSGKKAFAFVKP